MRITLFIMVLGLIGALFLWTTLSGALLWIFTSLYLLLTLVTIGFSDTAILFFLGAREVRRSDEPIFFEAAAQGAYKLSVATPELYFYNGTLERAFVLQNSDKISLVLNKSLIEQYQPSELAAICFELLLQVKQGMASKRTKVMFVLGFISWIAHVLSACFMTLIPFKEVRAACDWLLNYLLHPWLDFLFGLTMGKGYFKKILQGISEYPREYELLKRAGLKLRRPNEIYSSPTRKILQISSASRSRHFQNILALEFLPHEWDFIFNHEELERAE